MLTLHNWTPIVDWVDGHGSGYFCGDAQGGGLGSTRDGEGASCGYLNGDGYGNSVEYDCDSGNGRCRQAVLCTQGVAHLYVLSEVLRDVYNSEQ